MKLLVLFMASSSLIYANAKFTDLQFIPSQGVFLGETSLNSTTTTAEVGHVLRTMVKLSNDPISVIEPRELTVSPA